MNANQTCAVCGKTYAQESDYLVDTRRWRVCSSGHLWFNCRCGSTLMVKKGKFDWYAPECFMSEEARGVFNRLGNLKGLPHLPSIVMELQQMLADPKVEPRRIALELRRDPLLSGQVLRSAERLRLTRNSENPPIKSIEHAVVYMGVRSLSDMLVASALRSFPLPPSDFDADEFWSHAYLTGAIAEYLMRQHGSHLNADEVYVAASLANIGKIVVAFCFPPLATQITRETRDPKVLISWRAAERRFTSPEHTILGEIAASLWGLPEYVMQAARRHHDPISTNGSKVFEIYELAAVANQLAHRVRIQPHLVEEDILENFRERIAASSKAIDSLVADIMKIRRSLMPF